MNLNRLAISAGILVSVLLAVCVVLYVADRPAPSPTPAPVPAPRVVDADSTKAEIVLKAPDKTKVGQLVVLDASESTATSFTWELRGPKANHLIIDNGRRAVFSAEVSGDYTFILAVAKGDSVALKVHTIKVEGGPPQPGDDIAAKIAQWCASIKSPAKRDDALKLAQSFSSVTAIISDQMGPADIVEATKKSNRDALGNNIQNWVPFLEGLQGELKALAEAGKLPDGEAHRRIWRAIADGLKAYAESL